MNTRKTILYIFILIFLCFCNNKRDYFIDRLNQIEKNIDKRELSRFSKEKEEQKAVGFVYMNRNLAFKNEIYKIKKDKKLINFFKSKGINNDEDILNIIFTSLHRKLNSKDIDLKNQVKVFYNLRSSLVKCEEWQKQNLIKNDEFKIGDTVKIRIKINANNYCVRAIDCSNMNSEWKMDDNKDLLISGVVLKKYIYKSSSDINYMTIKILKFNKKNIKIYDSIYKVGGQLESVLNYDIIEPRSPKSLNKAKR